MAEGGLAEVFDGAKAVATPGTAVALAAAGTYARTLLVQARKLTGSNTGSVYLGISTVDKDTRQIIVLAAGTIQEIPIPEEQILDLAAVYIDADNANDGVTWLGMR